MDINKFVSLKRDSKPVSDKKDEMTIKDTPIKRQPTLLLPEPEFLTFFELVDKWGISNNYLHNQIFSGKIIPSINLREDQRYPAGVFFQDVPDPEDGSMSGWHMTYEEYCNRDPEKPSYLDDLPKYSRAVYCHFPEYRRNDADPDNYFFKYFNESAEQCGQFKSCSHSPKCPGSRWFHLNNANIINNKAEGERLFRFSIEQIRRFEQLVMNPITKPSEKISKDEAEMMGIEYVEQENTQDADSLSKNEIAKKGISKENVIKAFGKLNISGEQYNLKSPMKHYDKWILSSLIHRGGKGRGNSSFWNPVDLAFLIHSQFNVSMTSLNNAFKNHDFLSEFKDEWEEKYSRFS